MITSVRFRNFKCMPDDEIELKPLNVLVGPNASGKSNFVDAFCFLCDSIGTDVFGATERRGGWQDVVSRRVGVGATIELLFDLTMDRSVGPVGTNRVQYRADAAHYRLELGSDGAGPSVISEDLEVALNDGTQHREGFARSGDTAEWVGDIEPPTGQGSGPTMAVTEALKIRPFVQAAFFGHSYHLVQEYVRGWLYYNPQVYAARLASGAPGPAAMLDSFGSSLAAVLKAMEGSSSGQRMLDQIRQLMQYLIPDFDRVETTRQADGSVVWRIYEKSSAEPFFPRLMSDGTVRLLAILVAILNRPSTATLVMLEEPELHIHPQALQPVVEILQEASRDTQFIVTTHSPEFARCLAPEDLILVNKRDGISGLKRASSVEHVDQFLESFSLDELWLSGYLAGGRI
jgi:predicted ATPase